MLNGAVMRSIFFQLLGFSILIIGLTSCEKRICETTDFYHYTVQYDVKSVVAREYDENDQLIDEGSLTDGLGLQTYVYSSVNSMPMENGYEGPLRIYSPNDSGNYANLTVKVTPGYETLDIGESMTVDAYAGPEDDGIYVYHYSDSPDEVPRSFYHHQDDPSVVTRISDGYQVVSPLVSSLLLYADDPYQEGFLEIELVIDSIELLEGPELDQDTVCHSD